MNRGGLSSDNMALYLEIGEYFNLYDHDHDFRERVVAGIQAWDAPYIHGVLCLKCEAASK